MVMVASTDETAEDMARSLLYAVLGLRGDVQYIAFERCPRGVRGRVV